MMQQHCKIGRAIILTNVLYSATRFIGRSYSDYIWLDRAKKFTPRTGQPYPSAINGDHKTDFSREVESLGFPLPKWIALAVAQCDWEMMTLAHNMSPGASLHIDLWRNGSCNNTTCHRMHAYLSYNPIWHSRGGSPPQHVIQSYYSIDLLEGTTTTLVDVPNDQIIRAQDVEVEIMIWYIILCRCGLILLRCVPLSYLTTINRITWRIHGNLW
jgi:hypothetical protein